LVDPEVKRSHTHTHINKHVTFKAETETIQVEPEKLDDDDEEEVVQKTPFGNQSPQKSHTPFGAQTSTRTGYEETKSCKIL